MLTETLSTVFDPSTLLLMLLGLVVGMFFGVVPGLTGIQAIAMLTPFTYGMDPLKALVLVSAIYCSSVYAGSISAILFGIPGDPPSIMTSLDGYPMRKKGEAGRALVAAMVSSGVGGVVGVIVAWVGAISVVPVVLKFGPPEYFSLAALALSLVAALGTEHVAKALLSAVLGLLISTIGMDPVTGVHRFTFHLVSLSSGIDYVPAIIGLYAIGETLNQFTKHEEHVEMASQTRSGALPRLTFLSKGDFRLSLPHWLRNSFIGCFIGMLPGAGSTIAAIVGYGVSRVFGKEKEKFGQGAFEGVVGPETANNAAVGGAMVPLLTMGIPGSTCAALILTIFLIHGLQPGPLLFVSQPEYGNTIFLTMLISNILIGILPLFLVRYMVKCLQMPFELMGIIILYESLLGAFALNSRIYDVWVTAVFGILGYIMIKHEYSPAALTLGMVLGPMFERGFRQSLVMSGGDPSVFWTRPICTSMLMFAVLVVLLALAGSVLRGLRSARAQRQTA